MDVLIELVKLATALVTLVAAIISFMSKADGSSDRRKTKRVAKPAS